jgi:DNA-binding protein H-NS
VEYTPEVIDLFIKSCYGSSPRHHGGVRDNAQKCATEGSYVPKKFNGTTNQAGGINLNGLTLEELKSLQMQVGKAIATFEERKMAEALAEVEAKAKELGYTLAELTGKKMPKKRSPAEPKYANPANKAEVWSGRGRKPGWYIAALDRGLQPADLAIKKAA